MALKRYVTATSKDRGHITALCRPGEPWSPISKDLAIHDIELGNYEYWVSWGGESPCPGLPGLRPGGLRSLSRVPRIAESTP